MRASRGGGGDGCFAGYPLQLQPQPLKPAACALSPVRRELLVVACRSNALMILHSRRDAALSELIGMQPRARYGTGTGKCGMHSARVVFIAKPRSRRPALRCAALSCAPGLVLLLVLAFVVPPRDAYILYFIVRVYYFISRISGMEIAILRSAFRYE